MRPRRKIFLVYLIALYTGQVLTIGDEGNPEFILMDPEVGDRRKIKVHDALVTNHSVCAKKF